MSLLKMCVFRCTLAPDYGDHGPVDMALVPVYRAPKKLPRALAVNTARKDLRSEIHLHVENLGYLSPSNTD